MGLIETNRRGLLTGLCESILGLRAGGAPTMADADSVHSVAIGAALVDRLARDGFSPKRDLAVVAQTSGTTFTTHLVRYLRATFAEGLGAFRPGRWTVLPEANANLGAQYHHLKLLKELAEKAELLTHLGAAERHQIQAILYGDYSVKPDILILREPEEQGTLVAAGVIDSESRAARRSDLRRGDDSRRPSVHASVSCKWTIRSDRAQNIRTEALQLIRQRRGPMPHMVVVTCEPLPSRLAAVARGTGEVDFVYHVALDELVDGVAETVAADPSPSRREQSRILTMLIEGGRLRDIGDLPLDLAV
ncbi:MAG: type II restriction endonuclease [Actinobacteria bacterium]|nr:type II restriction endonuclease [Actinomycetota bacterium]